jgi:hypothetical protein
MEQKMNMISTGSFLTETSASTKQSELVKILTSAWEKKNSKAARAGGVSLMALSLAACGSSSDDSSGFSQADLDEAYDEGAAAEAAAMIEAINEALGTSLTGDEEASAIIATIAASNDAEIIADVDLTSDNATATSLALRNAAAELGVTGTSTMTDAELITAIKTANDADIAAGVDLTTNDASAINTAVAEDTAFDTLDELIAAYEALANPTTTTFNVTTEAIVYTGNSSDNTFLAASGAIDGRIIDGGDGTDTLSLTLTQDDNGSLINTTNVENIEIRVSGAATAAVTGIDMSEATGVEIVEVRRLNDDISLENLQSLDTVLRVEDISVDGISVTFDYENTVVSGTADAVTIQVDGATASTTAVAISLDTGIEVVNLSATGSGNIISLTATGASELNVSGTGDITLGTLSATDIDLSGNSGGVTLTASATQGLTIVGGSGDDTIDVSLATGATSSAAVVVGGGAGADNITIDNGAVNNTAVTITGGDGVDTLSVDLAAAANLGTTTATVASITGIEILDITGATSASGTVDLDAMGLDQVLTSISLSGDIQGLTLANLSSENIDVTHTATATAQTVSMSMSASATGTTDAIDIDITYASTASTTTATYAADSYTVDDYEQVSISLTAGDDDIDTSVVSLTLSATAATALDIAVGSGIDASLTLTATAVETITVTGDGDIDLNSLSGVSVVAGSAAGAITATMAGAAASAYSATFGAGDDTVTLGAGRFTVDMGAGDDTIALNVAGAADLTRRDSFDGGDGTDTLSLTMAGSYDIDASNIEVLSISGTGTVTVDQMDSLTSITMGTGTISVADIVVDDLDITFSDTSATVTIGLSTTTGTSDALSVSISNTASSAAAINLTADDFEAIDIDLDITNGTATATVTGNTLTASFAAATAISISAADDEFTSVTLTLGTAASTIDLTGVESDLGVIGTAWATGATAVVTTYGLILSSATSVDVTITLDDDSTGLVQSIDLGAANDGQDTIVFSAGGDDDAHDFGTIYISNFLDRTNYSADKATILDFTAYGVTALGDLTFTNDGSGSNVAITSTEFDGTVVLMGIDDTDLTTGNFDFIA